MFTFANYCLTTSNLPCFMNLTFPIPMQYCSLLHQILLSSPDNIPNWALFPLWPSCFILSGVVSSCPPLFPSSTLDTFQPGGLIFQCHSVLPFIQFMGSRGKYAGVVCHSLLQWTLFCQNSPLWRVCLGWPRMTGLIGSLIFNLLSIYFLLSVFPHCISPEVKVIFILFFYSFVHCCMLRS